MGDTQREPRASDFRVPRFWVHSLGSVIAGLGVVTILKYLQELVATFIFDVQLPSLIQIPVTIAVVILMIPGYLAGMLVYNGLLFAYIERFLPDEESTDPFIPTLPTMVGHGAATLVFAELAIMWIYPYTNTLNEMIAADPYNRMTTLAHFSLGFPVGVAVAVLVVTPLLWVLGIPITVGAKRD